MAIPWFENHSNTSLFRLFHYIPRSQHQLSSRKLCCSFQHYMCIGTTNTEGTYTGQRTSTLNTMSPCSLFDSSTNKLYKPKSKIHSSGLRKVVKFDDGHSRPNTTNPSTNGPCQLSDTAARLKGVLEKGFAKGVRRRVPQINFNETKFNKSIMINPNQSHQTKSCNLKQVCKEFQRTTCHLHRSCSSRLPRWDSLHEAMAPWIGASASERPWDSAFMPRHIPTLTSNIIRYIRYLDLTQSLTS